MIPALRVSVASAINQLNGALTSLRRGGNLTAPWLGDETSSEVAAHYAGRALNEPNSAYQSLVAYHAELRRVHDTLQRMEDEYLGADHQASADLRRRA
jgi:hypothetical protein